MILEIMQILNSNSLNNMIGFFNDKINLIINYYFLLLLPGKILIQSPHPMCLHPIDANSRIPQHVHLQALTFHFPG